MSSKNIDLNSLLSDIKTLIGSKNPMSFLMNLNSIRGKLSSFINHLGSLLKFGFSLSERDSSVSQIYKELGVGSLWEDLTKDFILNSEYFSLKDFFHFSLIFNENILLNKDFLNKYDIDPEDKNIDNKLVGIYNSLQNGHRKEFMSYFNFYINDDCSFSQISSSTSYIIDNYSLEEIDKIEHFFEKKGLKNVIIKIKAIATFFPGDKKSFLREINSIIENNNLENREHLVRKYAIFCLIETHFSSVKNIFYLYATNCFRTREEWSEMSISIDKIPKNLEYLKTFKEVILYLDSNFFSTILTPIVLFNLSQNLSISHRDMLKIQYIMLYFLPDSYKEYKIMYKFFNDIEIFYLYDNKSIVDIFRASFSLFVISIFVLYFLYIYMPIGIFLPILIITFSRVYKSLFDSSYMSKWNLGVEFFAGIILIFSFYSMVSSGNFDFSNINNLVKNAQDLFLVSSQDFVDISGEKIKASILEASSK